MGVEQYTWLSRYIYLDSRLTSSTLVIVITFTSPVGKRANTQCQRHIASIISLFIMQRNFLSLYVIGSLFPKSFACEINKKQFPYLLKIVISFVS